MCLAYVCGQTRRKYNRRGKRNCCGINSKGHGPPDFDQTARTCGDANDFNGGKAAMKQFALSRVYQLLEPGPVVLLTTIHRGNANVMTMSWHTMVEFEPPQIACVVSNTNYSFRGLCAARECVIAVPGSHLASLVVKIGNSSGSDTDKFTTFELTKVPSARVAPPLIKECFANLECKVTDTRFVNKYNIFILEVLKAWINPAQKNRRTLHHRGYGTFIVDGEIIKLKSRMR
jgi:flavin reductase (DIM6/NTAB) family NADH-FMN oxidoreductase RutF